MAATTIEWSSFLHSTVCVSVLQSVIKIKRLRSGYYTGFTGNATAVVSWTAHIKMQVWKNQVLPYRGVGSG